MKLYDCTFICFIIVSWYKRFLWQWSDCSYGNCSIIFWIFFDVIPLQAVTTQYTYAFIKFFIHFYKDILACFEITGNEKTIIWNLSIWHHWYIDLKSSLHSCCAIIDGIIFIKKRKKSNAVHLHWTRGVLIIINDVFVHSVFLEIFYLEWYLQIISKLFQTPITLFRWILISNKSILMYNLL